MKVYGPWSLLSADADEKAAHAVGAERILCEGAVAGKNSSDVHIAIDAVELTLFGCFDVFVFVIVSCDSSFAPVA